MLPSLDSAMTPDGALRFPKLSAEPKERRQSWGPGPMFPRVALGTTEPRRRKSTGEAVLDAMQKVPAIFQSSREVDAHSALKDLRSETPFLSQYELGSVIGVGSFSEVRMCTNRRDGRVWAVKIINLKPHPMQDSAKRKELKELELLASLRDTGCLQLKEYFIERAFSTERKVYVWQLYAVMELVPGGDLYAAVLERGSLAEEDAKGIFKSLLKSCMEMHSRGIVHRDMKPENLLLKDPDDLSRGVCVADFGLAAYIGDETLVVCGTPLYVAPEIIELGRLLKRKMPTGDYAYSSASDIWGCGAVLYFMLAGSLPFSAATLPKLFKAIVGGEVSYKDPVWSMISEEARDLIQRCLCLDPKNRITAAEALNHPWLSDV